MIKKGPKRIALKLTPLLDLLLIVIFAQFMDVRETAHADAQHQSQKTKQVQVENQTLREQLLRQNNQLLHIEEGQENERRTFANQRDQLIEKQNQLQKSLKRTRGQRESIGMLVKELFQIPVDQLADSLDPSKTDRRKLTPKQVEEIKSSINKMGAERVDRIVKHLLTYDEVIKRCDIWDLYLDGDHLIHLDIGKKSYTFRAETKGEFETRLFDLYKTFPEPKSLVILLYAFGDSSAGPRQAIENGLPRVTKRMAEDSQTKTHARFEYANLGFRPEIAPKKQ